MHILAEICTKDRYFTTLPLTIMSVINQTVLPDKVLIIDDGEKIDLRDNSVYANIFRILDDKGIAWEVKFGVGRGQHISHQEAQNSAKDLIWRIDDDEVAEPNVLEILLSHIENDDNVGAVAGLVLTPGAGKIVDNAENNIHKIFTSPNIQWFNGWDDIRSVDHLYSSFLYRKGVSNYETRLSTVAHREETIFTYNIKRSGYKLIVDPKAVTWHLRNPEGGIRSFKDDKLWGHDEEIFKEKLIEWGIFNTPEGYEKLIVLDSGIGDHIIFKTIIPDLLEKYGKLVISCCYNDVFYDIVGDNVRLISISDAKAILGDGVNNHNIYKYCWDNNWTGSFQDAYKKMYGLL